MQGEKGSATFPSLSNPAPERPGSGHRSDPRLEFRDRSVRRGAEPLLTVPRAQCLAVPHPARPASAERGGQEERASDRLPVSATDRRKAVRNLHAVPSGIHQGNHACGGCCRRPERLSALQLPFSTGGAQPLESSRFPSPRMRGEGAPEGRMRGLSRQLTPSPGLASLAHPLPAHAARGGKRLTNPCTGAGRHRSRHECCAPPRHRRSGTAGSCRRDCWRGSVAGRR
jgi:hypothetical protein